MQSDALTRDTPWPTNNGAVGDIRDALSGRREAGKPAPIPPAPAPEPTKTRPPQVSVLTARFEDLGGHPAFSQRFNATLVGYGLARTRDRHTRGRIQGLGG